MVSSETLYVRVKKRQRQQLFYLSLRYASSEMGSDLKEKDD